MVFCGVLQLLGVLPCVVELPLVMFFSLGVTFGDLNPSFFYLLGC
jgi:hypothetical protein